MLLPDPELQASYPEVVSKFETLHKTCEENRNYCLGRQTMPSQHEDRMPEILIPKQVELNQEEREWLPRLYEKYVTTPSTLDSGVGNQDKNGGV